MAKYKETFEIPARTVEIHRIDSDYFNHIKEVGIDYNTAQTLAAKGKPVYVKNIEINGMKKSFFFVKVSNKHYIEFLENNII